MKALSLDLRQRISEALDTNTSQAAIATRFAVSLSTVERIAAKKKRGIDLKPGGSTGRKPRIPKDKWLSFEAFVRSHHNATVQMLTLAWQEHYLTIAGQAHRNLPKGINFYDSTSVIRNEPIYGSTESA